MLTSNFIQKFTQKIQNTLQNSKIDSSSVKPHPPRTQKDTSVGQSGNSIPSDDKNILRSNQDPKSHKDDGEKANPQVSLPKNSLSNNQQATKTLNNLSNVTKAHKNKYFSSDSSSSQQHQKNGCGHEEKKYSIKGGLYEIQANVFGNENPDQSSESMNCLFKYQKFGQKDYGLYNSQQNNYNTLNQLLAKQKSPEFQRENQILTNNKYNKKTYKLNDEEPFNQIQEKSPQNQFEGLSETEKKQILLHRIHNQQNQLNEKKKYKAGLEQKNLKMNLSEDQIEEIQYPFKKNSQKQNLRPEYFQQKVPLQNSNKIPNSFLKKVNILNIDLNTLKIKNKPNDPDIIKSSTGLTDGRHYKESFRRSFIAKLLENTQYMQIDAINEVIQKASHRIDVHSYEIRTWLAAYKIIFIIQWQQQSKNIKFSETEILNRIGELLLGYFQQNKNQKRYRLLKILSYVFKSFKFSETQISFWLNQLIFEHRGKLKGIDFFQFGIQPDSILPQQGNFTNNSLYNQTGETVSNKEINYKMVPKSQVIKEKKSQKLIQNRTQDYPLSFKKNVANKIDKALKRSFQQIMKQQTEELCLPGATLKSFHEQFGQYTLAFKNTALKFSSSFQPPQNPIPKALNITPNPKNNQQLLNKLEQRLTCFIINNADFSIPMLQRQSDMVMEQFSFPERLSNEVRKKWFPYFLRKNKIKIPQIDPRAQKKANPHRIKTPLLPSPKQNSFKQHK